ncbi:hypothetical protein EV174_004253 [Coemansia sp. RSA 2320]|nr:hypothetical protein EV174_004253 [Coemansia sp. RSA 2320]
MRATVFRQAAFQAQYKWHRHVPLMRFVGPRKDVWAKPNPANSSSPAVALEPTATAADGGAINFWELPARYRPLPISAAEMEAIESGGASTH